jgi:hypothetical protein
VLVVVAGIPLVVGVGIGDGRLLREGWGLGSLPETMVRGRETDTQAGSKRVLENLEALLSSVLVDRLPSPALAGNPRRKQGTDDLTKPQNPPPTVLVEKSVQVSR